MTTIWLVVTGKCEELAMASALERVFSGVTFSALKYEGFTSGRLTLPLPYDAEMPTQAERLIAAALASVEAHPKKDFAVILDDLELVNRDQPDVVRSVMAQAVEHHVTRAYPKSLPEQNRARDLMRARVSLHLLTPMLEAYFFGEPAAVVRAGAAGGEDPVLLNKDLEAFESGDPQYLAVPPPEQTPVWATPDRAHHPKHYLQFLCEKAGKTYRESKGGVAALKDLAWSQVLASQQTCTALRTLMADVADMLGASPPFAGNTAVRSSTSLRNA